MSYDFMLTDLESAIPAGSRGRESAAGRWTTIAYEAEELKGALAMSSPKGGAPDIEIPLPLSGTFDLFLGLLINYCDRVKVKLASDRCFDRVSHSPPTGPTARGIEEVHWRTATLNGSDSLIIRQQHGYRVAIAYVAARSATPGTPGTPGSPGNPPTAGSPESSGSNSARQYLVHVTDDGFPGNWGVPDDDEDYLWMIEPMARAGVDMVSRGVDIAGMAGYATRHDDLRVDTARTLRGQFSADVYETAYRVLDDQIRRGFCSPRRYFELARLSGIEAAGYLRLGKIQAPPPFECFRSRLHEEHPEFRCVDISGRPVNRLSVAFPQVRQQYLKLVTETVEMGARGVNIVFVRGLPLVLYEEPVAGALGERYGLDPAALPENDPRAMEVRAQFVTAFMQEIRRAIDAAGSRVKLIATVPATAEVCGFFGLDVAGWIAAGLIDVLCPYPWGFEAAPTPIDMDHYCAMVKGTAVKLLPFANTFREKQPALLLEAALKLTDWPIDGVSVWDRYSGGPAFLAAIRSMHSAQTMRQALGDAQAGPRIRGIHTMGGMLIDKYHFGWAL